MDELAKQSKRQVSANTGCPAFAGHDSGAFGGGLLRALAVVAALAIMVARPPAVAQAPQFTPRDESPEDFPAGPGRDDAFYACTACHNFKLVAQQGMTRRQWEDSLQWMTDRHGMTPLKADEQKIVLDYLESTFPPRTPAGRSGFQNPFAPR
jgi:hypothetical protein